MPGIFWGLLGTVFTPPRDLFSSWHPSASMLSLLPLNWKTSTIPLISDQEEICTMTIWSRVLIFGTGFFIFSRQVFRIVSNCRNHSEYLPRENKMKNYKNSVINTTETQNKRFSGTAHFNILEAVDRMDAAARNRTEELPHLVPPKTEDVIRILSRRMF